MRYRIPHATNPDSVRETRTGSPKAPAVPIRSCSRWGLPCQSRYRNCGALLPHPFTLAWLSVAGLPGGLLSVALSLGLPPPDVIRHRVLLEPGLSSQRTQPANRSGDIARSSSRLVSCGYCSTVMHPMHPLPICTNATKSCKIAYQANRNAVIPGEKVPKQRQEHEWG